MAAAQSVAAARSLLTLGLGGAASLYALSNSVFNVDGGHRAIIFSRISGVREKHRSPTRLTRAAPPDQEHRACVVPRATAPAEGVLLTAAHPPQVYPEGTHLMLPWFERAIIYDVRAAPSIVQSTSGTSDLQMVRSAPAPPHQPVLKLLRRR